VTTSKTAEKYKRELQALAKGLPFSVNALPEFKKLNYEPDIVRQDRTYTENLSKLPPITRFLVQRGTVQLLTPEQIISLFKEIHWRGYIIQKLARRRCKETAQLRKTVVEARKMISEIEAAEEELFMANRRLIVSCTRPYFWIGQVWLIDFLQEGSKALTNAVRKFDFSRGTPFFSYAQTAIRNRLRNYFRDHTRSGSIGIRPSREMIAVKRILDEWKERNEEPPTTKVLQKLTGLDKEKITKTLASIRQWETLPAPPFSLDATIAGDDNTSLYHFIEDERGDSAIEYAQRSEIWSAVDRLTPRARYIMKLRYQEGHTLEETGQELGLTRARIKQIQDEALKKLRLILRRNTEL